MIVNSSLLEEMVKEAIELINDKSISVRSYVCDPESCGHRESVILSYVGYVPICFSIDELREFLLSKPINTSMVEGCCCLC